jgi:hypothetical protein
MLKVKILIPVDGYEVGDTPEMTGNRFRELEATGHVERADEASKPAKKGKRT